VIETSVSVPSQTRLTNAILLYGGVAHKPSVATLHDIQEVQGAPTCLPGRLMTRNDLSQLMGSLGRQSKQASRWIDTTDLVQSNEHMVWWTPPTQRGMFFQTSSKSATQFSGGGLVAIPGLIWAVQNRQLFVWAVKGKERPKPEDDLYQAPFFNVWGSGEVCCGSAELPSGDKAKITQQWVDAFFGSRFTHPNFKQADRLILGIEPGMYWKAQLTKPSKSFPQRRLVKLPVKAGDLTNADFTKILAARIATPEGEF
jgi:PRTRC genetic system protein B